MFRNENIKHSYLRTESMYTSKLQTFQTERSIGYLSISIDNRIMTHQLMHCTE